MPAFSKQPHQRAHGGRYAGLCMEAAQFTKHQPMIRPKRDPRRARHSLGNVLVPSLGVRQVPVAVQRYVHETLRSHSTTHATKSA